MKRNYIYWVLGAFGLFVLVTFIFAYSYFIQHLPEMFYGAIGMLTFTSIFYGFTVSSGAKLLNQVTVYFERKRIGLKKELEKITKAKHDKNFSEKIREIANENENIDLIMDYLNLPKWLFISTISYMISIAFFIIRDKLWTNIVQVIGFWFGFYSTLIIVVSWFIVNIISNRKLKK